MLAIPPRARQAPEVRQVFEFYLLAFQHSPFGARFCKRTPGVCAAVVYVDFEALAAVEDAGKLSLDLAGDLEERGRVEIVCVRKKGILEVMFVDPIA